MGFMDILQQYAQSGQRNDAETHAHFDEVAEQAPAGTLGTGIANAFRSDRTPPFPDIIGNLFGQSNGQQQAGALNQLLASIAPGMLSGLAGGALGRVLGGGGGSTAPRLTADQASQLTPAQVSEIAAHAEQNDPTVVDRLGAFYAEHPTLVKTLGAVALSAVMGKMMHR